MAGAVGESLYMYECNDENCASSRAEQAEPGQGSPLTRLEKEGCVRDVSPDM
jgi:hypothetical protein